MPQAKGGRLDAGSSGKRVPPHLTLASFNDPDKSDMQHVSCKDAIPAITDPIGGPLEVIFSNFPWGMRT